ncbi:hypothetical protein [Leptospira kirschneri]|uniref:hypothetical protein n=1 Tax=Leptospira kirschneri TaxID=29507 RepID=UPI0002784FF8|nr:hypothetical protein [Leptospira kirschneri]EJO68215.1 hypothetical protein LEP1GSC044_0116 [Leptospira kirschneri serovar Grippotyphosa str. RM52]EKQ83328.1 hypothetical protein LEP1GSC064_1118 [Leptospira kirschneri serovar Grippotyphosa str. Moskva]EKR07844.1 hypothetical protein LEP1GSC122_2299 [Leptospira kirschneri serovar Valbuzzi str. 200702274]EMN27665.1 hypothetical protein LEP1GSC065_0094 [Leptospira kirschneri serovar Sokoine str. RM1]KON78436.1 Uncharacterized protein NV38_0000
MSGNDKKILEQNSHGEFELTAYGEFLSYFHTHIQLFNGLISGKKISPTDQETLKQKVRSYIVSNIQKTEQFFDHLPKFAEFLGMSQSDLSAFMTKNFMNTHAGIKNKLIEQEKANIGKPKRKRYSRISEEILETIGELVPPGKRFIGMEGYVVLRDDATGKDLEPSASSFGEAPKQANEESESGQGVVKKVTPQTSSPAVPLKKQPEKLILTEILDRFGSEFSGKVLELKREEFEEAEITAPVAVGGNEELLTEVEDLQFEGFEEPTFLEDTSVEPEEPPVNIPFSKYMESVNRVRQFQKDGQPDAYKKWVMALPSELSALIQLHSFVLKEMKNEPLDWNSTLSSISSRTGLTEKRLWKVLDLTRIFAEFRAGLEKAFVSSKTAGPGMEELVKKAWPHILKIFEEYPNTSSLRQKLDQLFTRIPDATQRKKLSDLFLPLLQKL